MLMASVDRSNAVVELGKRLVEQLAPDGDPDIPTRWMAHHLAERIAVAESAAPQDRSQAESECAEAVLQVWRHRYMLPTGTRPFEELEGVADAIASLDPDASPFRYHAAAQSAASSATEPEVKQWLELAQGFDYSARLRIQLCLRSAAARAAHSAQEWVVLAENARVDLGLELPIIRFVSEGEKRENLSASRAAAFREKLEDRLRRLTSFTDAAQALVADIREQLSEVGGGADRAGEEDVDDCS